MELEKPMKKTISTKDGILDFVEKPIIVDNKQKGKHIKYKGKKKNMEFSGEKISYKDENQEGKVQIHREVFVSSNLPGNLPKVISESETLNLPTKKAIIEEIKDDGKIIEPDILTPKLSLSEDFPKKTPEIKSPSETFPETEVIQPKETLSSFKTMIDRIVDDIEREGKISGGNKYLKKYLKYKMKYTKLRNKVISGGKNIFHTNIEKETIENKEYRKILNTGKYMQLVSMSLKPHENIPLELHIADQFIRVEKGIASVIISKNNYKLEDGDCIVIPANTEHYIENIGRDDLKLYTIYSPPQH